VTARENEHPNDMPEMDDVHPSGLFAAYALHALSAEETATVEEYLATHPDAAREVAVLKEAAAMLPYSVPPITPSPQLRLRVMADVYREALAESDEQPHLRVERPVPIERARAWRGGGMIWPFAAVILLVLSIGFGGWAVVLNRDLNQKEQTITAAGTAKPLVATTPGVPARGELLRLASNQAAVLTISGLPPLTGGKVYQVWFIAGTTPVAAGLFSPNTDGSWSGLVRGDVTSAQAIAISIEPPGGSAAPTGDIVVKGSL
jgi:anti-sigma-K factor RskA